MSNSLFKEVQKKQIINTRIAEVNSRSKPAGHPGSAVDLGNLGEVSLYFRVTQIRIGPIEESSNPKNASKQGTADNKIHHGSDSDCTRR